MRAWGKVAENTLSAVIGLILIVCGIATVIALAWYSLSIGGLVALAVVGLALWTFR